MLFSIFLSRLPAPLSPFHWPNEILGLSPPASNSLGFQLRKFRAFLARRDKTEKTYGFLLALFGFAWWILITGPNGLFR